MAADGASHHLSIQHPFDLFWSLADGPFGDRDLRRPHAQARALTRCFYVGLLSIAFRHLSLWDYYLGLRCIQPLWPVAWTAAVPPRMAAAAVLLLFVLGSLVAACVPDRLLARSLAFVGCLEFFAFLYSFGTIRHVHHLLLLATLLLVLLPSGRGDDDAGKRAYLRAFWGVQCGVLLTYSMSGSLKLLSGLWHLASRGEGVFTPSAFSLHVASSGFRFGVEPLLGGMALRWGALGLPLYLGVIYVELVSIAVAFRPSLHRAWGAVLIALHIAIALTLNLFFLPSILVLGVFLLASPFAPDRLDGRRAARDLPLVGRLLIPDERKPAGQAPTA
ncbi:MAG TPA: hypothetical protein VFB95_00330 [Candidatus Cryosericum sp.]|nr:hypothetical protein [Candidatus Cryosericum sp.]